MTARPNGLVAPCADQEPSARWALAGLSVAMMLPALGISITNVALPTLAAAFNSSFQHVQWIVVAYLLASTILIVSVGQLGDMVGRRRLLLSGIVLFTAASALGSVAPTLGLLIAVRAAQGLGAAIMMVLTLAFVGQTVPKARTGSAMGLLGTMSAVGTALGPSLGGLLIEGFGWPAIFLINVPLGALALFLAYRHLPPDPDAQAAQTAGFDHLGTFLLALALGAYALALTLGDGSFGRLNVALLTAAVSGAALFVLAERRATAPLIRLALFRNSMLSAGLAMNMLVSTMMMATLVVGPFYLARALALDAALVGVIMSVGPLVAALVGAPAGSMVDRFGPGRITIAGLMGLGTGSCLLSVVPTALGVCGYIFPIVVTTAGYAMFQAANNTAVMTATAPERRGLVSGMLNLSRNLGFITGACVIGAVFALSSGMTDMATAAPEAVAHGMRMSFTTTAVLIALALAIAISGRVLPGDDTGLGPQAP